MFGAHGGSSCGFEGSGMGKRQGMESRRSFHGLSSIGVLLVSSRMANANMNIKAVLWDILALSRTFIFVSGTKVPRTLVGDEQHMLWLNLYLRAS